MSGRFAQLASRWREAVHGGSTTAAAGAIGVSRQTVCSWIGGQWSPSAVQQRRMRADLERIGVAAPEGQAVPGCDPGDEWLLQAVRQAADTPCADRLVLRRRKTYVAVSLDIPRSAPVCRLSGPKMRDGADGAGLPGSRAEFFAAGGRKLRCRLGPGGLQDVAKEMKAAVQAAEENGTC